jgi:type III restriction enzyme
MEFKEYQQGVLDKLDYYIQTLAEEKEEAEDYQAFQASKGKSVPLSNCAEKAWDKLVQERRLPYLMTKQGGLVPPPYISRYDGLDRSIANICLKVPTGGGKTLLGAAAVERLQTDLFRQQSGLVIWVVPSDAIYKQTWKQLANREHPYRQILERASGGRVKMLEKNDAFTRRDIEESLCVMLLMLPSAARKSKETLRMFRDSGKFTSFFPIEDDSPANDALLKSVSNLDTNDLTEYGWQDGVAPASVSIKQSLGNVMRLARPVIVIDEGHKAYSDTARETLCSFNPKFILELSATPNSGGKHHSNVLVNVPGSNLKDEEMIKLPINVINEAKGDWKHTLTLAHQQLTALQKSAVKLQGDNGRYIRPIMVIRVERTGDNQRDSGYIHAEDAREYLQDQLGVHEDEIRLKTSDSDELGDDDLMLDTCKVRYIITKDALREGWDCPFAYILTILSKMTAHTAITQMIGRVLRQPHAELTHTPALDERYVFTFDQDVNDAVDSVRKGLEEEGMGDIAGSVRTQDPSNQAKVQRKETLKLRDKYQTIPQIFLPRILHKDSTSAGGFRAFDYDRDILGEIDWDSVSFLSNAQAIELADDKLQRTIAKIGYSDTNKDGQKILGLELEQQVSDYDTLTGLDIPFLVRQLGEHIPNPWQAMRILEETLDILRSRSITDAQIYANRMELLRSMKLDLRSQVSSLSESLFREKIESGDISLRLMASQNKQLNWELARTLEVTINEDDQILRKRDGSDIEKSLFEKVYQSELNNLERDTAWYLDSRDCVYWWHRIAVQKSNYSLQGWQRQRVYPDLLVCVEDNGSGVRRFSVLETKGEHLKGNDDTEYKRRLFELLTEHVQTAVKSGELTLEAAGGGMSFTMLMEDIWQQSLSGEDIK